MCGIVGYTGNAQATPILLEGLNRLEYRGYDSAGVAVRTPEGKHEIVKAKGKLSILNDMLDGGKSLSGTCGIGHTRWATHGEPNEVNAHPHANEDKTIVAVHNGIIENYLELKEKLKNKGYVFHSDTDTEIATKLVDYYYRKWQDPLKAMVSVSLRVRGSYAFAVMFEDMPEKIFVARKDSPLIVGLTEDCALCASDVPAILKYTRKVYFLNNQEIACLEKGKATFYNVDSEVLKKKPVFIDWDVESAEKGGFEHFMMKEIHEQPQAVKNTLASFVKDGRINFGTPKLSDEFLNKLERVHIVACGSAYHAGMVAKYVLEDLAKVPVDIDVASEYRYRNVVLGKNDAVILISQSGETADTLAALRKTKEEKIPTIAIVNVVGSSMAREADVSLFTKAGPEISVATTKAYSAQLIVGYLFAVQLAYAKGVISEQKYLQLIEELGTIPDKILKILANDEKIKWFSNKIINKTDIFFIGRGIDYAICLEGSLKLKEISYIHSEAYAAGELKHGTISLIDKDTPVIGVVTQPDIAEKSVSNIVEVKARGAYVMGLTVRGNYVMSKNSQFTVYVPKTEPFFAASLAVIPLQLLSYYVSVSKGLDVDKPRNLAKCVAVE